MKSARRTKARLVTAPVPFLLWAGVCLLAGCGGVKIPPRPEQIVLKPVEFTPPAIQEWTEDSGLRVMLLPSPELPLVEGTIYFPYGSYVEPKDRTGFTDALFSQLRAGGVKGKAPLEVDKALDSIGASIEGAGGKEFSSVNFFSHKDDFNTVFGLLGEILRAPSFDQERLKLWKVRSLDAIARRREEAETVAAMTFARALYGDSSPYSAFESRKSIEKIDSQTLANLAKHIVAPNGALLTVTGRMTRDELHAAIADHFKLWRQSYPERSEIPAPAYSNRPGIYVVEGNFDQAAVVMGEPGPARLSPDQYALSVFNRYFSRGEFGSVLFTEIRSKRGYAYEVDGGFAPGAKGGEYIIELGSRTPEAPNAIAEVLRQIGRSHSETASESRLAEIRKSIGQGFVFNFATPQGAIARQATLRLLHYPADFNDTYIRQINAVAESDLLNVSKTHLDPSKFIIVVVGKISAKELSRLFGESYPVYRVRFETEPVIDKSPFQGPAKPGKS